MGQAGGPHVEFLVVAAGLLAVGVVGTLGANMTTAAACVLVGAGAVLAAAAFLL